MIIVRLRGGLGNQLFQYAAGRSLADHHGTELKLDLYTYSRHRYRKFELGNFQMDSLIAGRQEVHHFTGRTMLQRYLNKRENYFRCPKVFAQPHYHFYEDFFALPSDLYLSGYWQSEKYFLSISNKIREWYSPRQPLDAKNLDWISKMSDTASVSVHVRMGDYTHGDYNHFFGGVPDGYYEKAIEEIRQRVTNPTFFVFSDDIEWCKKNLSIGPAEFVDGNRGAASFKDLFLMAACQHQVIANSTFSWWGAWLNSNPVKCVIAPQPWFRKDYNEKKEPVYPCRYYNTKDLLPTQWIKVG